MKNQRCQSLTKAKARYDTTITKYRSLFGESLPSEKQYWTLCSEQLSDPHSEINQVIGSNLISAGQFHGIDYSGENIKKNRSRFPQSNWYEGEFIDTLYTIKDFNPGIVYYDSTNSISKIIKSLNVLLSMISHGDIKDVLIVVNFIQKYRGVQDESSDIVEKIRNDVELQRLLKSDKGLMILDALDSYPNSQTTMTTIYFVRR